MDLEQVLEKQLAPFTRHLVDTAIDDAASFTFDKHDGQHLSSICVYCTILELARSEITLFDNDDVIAMPVVLRSIFESFADLRAILVDADYYKSMYATLLQQKHRFLRDVDRSHSNPVLTPISQRLDVKMETAKVYEELQEYKRLGRMPLSISDRFKAANLGHEYESIYWLLCLEGHNNISALDDRHIEKTGEEFEVQMFKEPESDDLVRVLDTLAGVVLDSTIKLHVFLETGLDEKYKMLEDELSVIRKNYSSA